MPQSVADESHGEAHLPSEMPVSSRRDDDDERRRQDEGRREERNGETEPTGNGLCEGTSRKCPGEKRPRQGPQADSQRGLSRVTHHLSRG